MLIVSDVIDAQLPVHTHPTFNQKPDTMNYRTAKNDRRRRRKARFITALITTILLVAAAYTFGAFDDLLELAPIEMAVEQTVAKA